jgi:hypothetical protein
VKFTDKFIKIHLWELFRKKCVRICKKKDELKLRNQDHLWAGLVTICLAIFPQQNVVYSSGYFNPINLVF